MQWHLGQASVRPVTRLQLKPPKAELSNGPILARHSPPMRDDGQFARKGISVR